MSKLIFLFLLIPLITVSQNTNISGTINTYSEVNSISGNTINIPSTVGFSQGDVALIIQMQGATMDETNTAAFGDVISYNDVGNYEFVTICSVISNTELSVNDIQRSYASGGVTQLVHVPVYTNATVTSALTAAPWNGLTGGVLAFQCIGDLTLNADISADHIGFRGGSVATSGYSCAWFDNVNDYFYDISTGEGAEKGEGIAYYVATKTSGRGPQVNGGGGGNDHNAGGAGGSNAGAGGDGGERIKPSTFTCSGSFPGLGGNAIPYSNVENKIFLGGGGGAGHENNPGTGTPGANGGGIVLIKANEIIGNGQTISANGQSQLTSSADGAGGGGGGGTVLLDAVLYTGNLTVHVIGGNGGNVSNIGPSNCNGPGGGGGGGAFWISQASLPGSIAVSNFAGASGTTLNTTQGNCTLSGNNDAQTGNSGMTLTNLTPMGPICNVPPVITSLSICDGDSTYLEGAWQMTSGVYFDTISTGCCDTLVQTTLTVDSVIMSTLNQTICHGDSIVVNGNIYNSTIIGAIETFQGAGINGCDSIVTINLTVLGLIETTDTIVACESYTWIDGLTYTSSNATATHTVVNGASNGCDSIVNLNLTINTVDVSTSSSGLMITANAAGALYQWLDCENSFAPIVGETGQSFAASVNGSYAVRISENNCVDTSACVAISTIGIDGQEWREQIKIYPNPSMGDVNIDLGKLNHVSIQIRDVTGRIVSSHSNVNSRLFKLELDVLPGVYNIEIKAEGESMIYSIVIK